MYDNNNQTCCPIVELRDDIDICCIQTLRPHKGFVHRERTLLMKCLHACAKKRAIYIGSQAYIVIATIVDYLFSLCWRLAIKQTIPGI